MKNLIQALEDAICQAENLDDDDVTPQPVLDALKTLDDYGITYSAEVKDLTYYTLDNLVTLIDEALSFAKGIER